MYIINIIIYIIIRHQHLNLVQFISCIEVYIMSNECIICGKVLNSAQEIEAGSCFDHLVYEEDIQSRNEISPLDFDTENYYGVTDSWEKSDDFMATEE